MNSTVWPGSPIQGVWVWEHRAKPAPGSGYHSGSYSVRKQIRQHQLYWVTQKCSVSVCVTASSYFHFMFAMWFGGFACSSERPWRDIKVMENVCMCARMCVCTACESWSVCPCIWVNSHLIECVPHYHHPTSPACSLVCVLRYRVCVSICDFWVSQPEPKHFQMW